MVSRPDPKSSEYDTNPFNANLVAPVALSLSHWSEIPVTTNKKKEFPVDMIDPKHI